MGKLTTLALRGVLAIVLVGSVLTQALMIFTLIADKEESADIVELRLPLFIIGILGIVTVQITLVCVWRLLSMARRGTVFSHAAFKYVDIVIGAIAASAVLILAADVTMFSMMPKDDPGPPGVLVIVAGVAVLAVGVALIVYVLRTLLAQAVARDAEANQLRSELDEVV